MFSKNLTIALDDKEAGVSEELRIIHKTLRKFSKDLKIVIQKYIIRLDKKGRQLQQGCLGS